MIQKRWLMQFSKLIDKKLCSIRVSKVTHSVRDTVSVESSISGVQEICCPCFRNLVSRKLNDIWYHWRIFARVWSLKWKKRWLERLFEYETYETACME